MSETNSEAEETVAEDTGALLEEPEKTLEQQAKEDGVDFTPEVVEPEAGAKPDWLPDNFWDAENKAPKVEDVVKAYKASSTEAKRLAGELKNAGKGEVPEAYDLKLPEGIESLSDAEIGRFKEAGLSNDQAQKVLDMVVETVGPVVADAMRDAENAKLGALWGVESGTEVFGERMKQLAGWAYAQFPKEVVKHMSRSAQGVDQLWQMMQRGEGAPGGKSESSGPVSQDKLMDMMRDERYQRGDPSYVAEVERAAGMRT